MADIAERDPELQIVYGIDGERDLEERTLDHLSGYEGARPVRVGNGAYKQHQHDVWGAVIESIYLHAESRDHLPERWWPILKRLVQQALDHWREPDCGMWEVRGQPQHFTSSKLMCWVAVDRGARLARLREDWETAKQWQAAADEIHADICAHGIDERGVFVQHYGTTALDASVLLMVHAAIPAAGGSTHSGHGAGDRRRADRRRAGAAVPRGADRRRPGGRGGHVSAVLVLAGVGVFGDWRAPSRTPVVREAAVVCQLRWLCMPKRSIPAAADTWAISRKASPIWH